MQLFQKAATEGGQTSVLASRAHGRANSSLKQSPPLRFFFCNSFASSSSEDRSHFRVQLSFILCHVIWGQEECESQ